MTRIAPLLLALALTLGACDAAAPSSAADATSAPAPMANAKSDAVHRITEAVSVFVEGDRVLLEVEGRVVALGAGEAYLIGQTLARVGYETLSPEMAEVFPPPRGGDKCEPPPPGSGVLAVGGSVFAGGGGGCPPPPPPFALLKADVLTQFLDGAPVKVVEAPEGADWTSVPGGFTAPY